MEIRELRRRTRGAKQLLRRSGYYPCKVVEAADARRLLWNHGDVVDEWQIAVDVANEMRERFERTDPHAADYEAAKKAAELSQRWYVLLDLYLQRIAKAMRFQGDEFSRILWAITDHDLTWQGFEDMESVTYKARKIRAVESLAAWLTAH